MTKFEKIIAFVVVLIGINVGIYGAKEYREQAAAITRITAAHNEQEHWRYNILKARLAARQQWGDTWEYERQLEDSYRQWEPKPEEKAPVKGCGISHVLLAATSLTIGVGLMLVIAVIALR